MCVPIPTSVIHRYGQFSHLWVDMQQRMGLDVTVIECPWGDGAHEDKLQQILKQDTGKKIKAVSGGGQQGLGARVHL
jgi:alanine-glyoxylate transaminase/serine-glyoxylate transaminase/serine-pyruvate transaminase